ncbi:MAG TPA: glycosyltransferase [Flavitalea sp.]|nr:glycosyltransferase [Flavitalea sp.]
MLIFISIFFICLVAYARLIHFYYKQWSRVPEYTAAEETEYPTISVIIPFRNEASNLPSLLNCLRELDYPADKLQVIFIDDDSKDDSVSIIKDAAQDLPFLCLEKLEATDTESSISYKKRAIEKGIRSSTGTWIITTDADCTFEKLWLKTLASFIYSTGAKCIAAPVKIVPVRTVLSLFESLDFLTLQGITAAAVHSRTHVMCNGANFAYTRAVYQEVDGFTGIDNIPSGDDMLLMQKIFDKYPADVHYLKAEQAIVSTRAAAGWKAFFQQRIRWASKTDHYTDKKIFWILGLVWIYNLCFVVLTCIVFAFPKWAFLLMLFVLAKWLIEYAFVASVAGFFKLSRLMHYFLLMQPLHIMYTIVAGFLGRFGSYEWKGRRVKRMQHE